MSKLRSLTKEQLTDKLLAWCYYFQKEGLIEEDDMPVLLRDDNTFRKAHKEYVEFTANDALMEAMEAREKWQRDQATRMNRAINKGRLEGLQEGMEKGLEKGMQESAKKMLNKGYSIEDIADITGLNKEEIESLRE